MICQKCGTNLPEKSEFCPNCGSKLEKSKRKMKKIEKVFIFIGVILVLLIVCFLFLKKNDKNYGGLSSSEQITYHYNEERSLKFIDGKFSNQLVKSKEDVIDSLESIKEQIGITNINEELEFSSEESNENITYYKFNQVYKGLPVFYQNIVVSVDKEGNILSYGGYLVPSITVDTNPKKEKIDIEEIVKKYLGENSTIMSNELGIWGNIKDSQLVYHVVGYSNTLAKDLMVSASTGEILSSSDIFYTAETYSYTGLGMDNKTYTINLEEYFDLLGGAKNRYNFYDLERKISIDDFRLLGPVVSVLLSAVPGTTPIVVDIENGKIDMTWENETFIQSAITTMAHFETIYDYYKNILDRNSYDNKGSKIIVNLGVDAKTFTKKDLNNAMWFDLTKQMYIGNYKGKSYSASLDVLAHEFTHGVVFSVSNFAGIPKEGNENKAFETGALNEAYSDIIGSLIEGKNWTIAENNEILRDLSNPKKYKQPTAKGEEYYYPDGFLKNGMTLQELLKSKGIEKVMDYDKGGVHDNSTVIGYAAYLMYESGAFKNREEMSKIWYNSLFLLSSYSDFEDCALAIIKTAKNFNLSEDSIRKITKAFYDTNILEKKEYTISGTVKSGAEKLDNILVKVFLDDEEIASTTTNKEGNYTIKLKSEEYKIEFSKKGFDNYETKINLNGETTLNVNLASSKLKGNGSFKNMCKTEDCVNVTMYYLDGNDAKEITSNYETIKVDKGTILGANEIVNMANSYLDRINAKMYTDGKTFYMTVGELKFDFAWYYKGTNTKFDWNEPISKDIEIEMKSFDGVIDDDLIQEFESMFN